MLLKLIKDQSKEDFASEAKDKSSKKKTSSVARSIVPLATFKTNWIPKKKKKKIFESQFFGTRKIIPAKIKNAPRSNKKYLGKNWRPSVAKLMTS